MQKCIISLEYAEFVFFPTLRIMIKKKKNIGFHYSIYNTMIVSRYIFNWPRSDIINRFFNRLMIPARIVRQTMHSHIM